MSDKDGYQVLLFDAIVDHKRDEMAMTKADQTFVWRMAENTSDDQLEVRNCAYSVKMVPPRGRNCLTSRIVILLRQLNMPMHAILMTSQHSTGG